MSRAPVLALLLSILCALGCSRALAQELDAKTYDGTWSVRLQGPDRIARDATLVIDGYDGNWQDRPGKGRAAKSGCAGKKVSMTVQSSTRTLLAFTVWGEVVAPTCPTLTVIVKPVGEKVLEGTVDLDSHASEPPEVHASHSGGAGASPAASAATDASRAGSAGSIRLTRR